MSERIGNTAFSHYRLISKLGEGGMGVVYLAQDTKLDRKVAIKFLHEEFSKDADKLGRFVQEARAASALNHPNILTVYEIGEVDGKNYITTELIDGHTVREQLSRKEPLQLGQILRIGVQVSEALSAAHQAGIIHRDVKPENIMLRKDGYAKVLDFGLAKLGERRGDAVTGGQGDGVTGRRDDENNTLIAASLLPPVPPSPRLPFPASPVVKTTPGLIMGTVSYMSPEQARGHATDARTDIWSLGVVIYEMLAGTVPFTGETVNHTIVSILEKEPQSLTNIPPELQRIVRKSMTKDVDMRYQTAHDLLIDLKNLRRELDIQGELERSIMPNLETANTSLENPTQMYEADATKSTAAGTTQGVRTSSSSLEYAVTQAKSHKLATAIIGIVLLAIAATIAYFVFVSKAGTGQNHSIAVMPFVNESGNADLEYLSDGMTETLINSLSQLPNLQIKSRSSVFRYKGKEFDPKKIATELNVQALLTGRITQRGDQLTLSVELIDPATDNVLWGNKYERTSSQLIALQNDVARDVSNKITKLSSTDEAKLTKTYTTNAEAYKFFLKGRYFSRQFTLNGFQTGVAAFNQAIDLDPNYALAYAGLSDAYFYASTVHLPPSEALPKAEHYARKALEHDDSLAAAHHSIANVKANYERDFTGAKREFDRAVELDPHDSLTYFDYSWLLAILGENKRAVELAERGAQIDPLDGQISANVIGTYVVARRYDEALEKVPATIKLDDKVWWTYYWQGVAYSEKGMHDKAIESLQIAARLDDSPLIRGALANVFARAGRTADAHRVIEDLIVLSKSKFVAQSTIAMGYVGLGDKDQAFVWLDKSYESHDEAIFWIKNHPLFVPLRNDPRYRPLLKRLNLN